MSKSLKWLLRVTQIESQSFYSTKLQLTSSYQLLCNNQQLITQQTTSIGECMYNNKYLMQQQIDKLQSKKKQQKPNQSSKL